MAATATPQGSAWSDIMPAADATAESWIRALRGREDAVSAATLGGIHGDPENFDFTRRLLELVAGTEDAFASAVGLHEVARSVPAAMGTRDRLALRAGGVASLGLPWAVMPVARRWLRSRLSTLVLAAKLPTPEAGEVPATPARLHALSEGLHRLRAAGLTPVLEPLGAAVHGPDQAAAEVRRLAALAAHPAVTHLSVDPERIAPGGTEWSADTDIAAAAAALLPILRAAAEHGSTVHVVPRSVRWTRLVPAVLTRALTDPALDRARVGTRLCAELPESRELYDQLSRWAQRRVADGGAPAEVVIGISRLAGAERVASIHDGLPIPVLEDATETTAQLLRLTDLALHQGRAAVLRPVLASEDPGVLALVAELAAQRGLSELVSVQLRSGIVPGLAEAVAERGLDVRVVLPAVAPNEFAGAVGLLVGLAAEAADPESATARVDALLSAARDEDPSGAAESGGGAAGAGAGAGAESGAAAGTGGTAGAAGATGAAGAAGVDPVASTTDGAVNPAGAEGADPAGFSGADPHRPAGAAGIRDAAGSSVADVGAGVGAGMDPAPAGADAAEAGVDSVPADADPARAEADPARPGTGLVHGGNDASDLGVVSVDGDGAAAAAAGPGATLASLLRAERSSLRDAAERSLTPAPVSHRTQLRAREWDPSERDSALFYRAPDEPARFDTGGLTAAVLGLGRDSAGVIQLEALAPPRAIPAISQSGFANEPGTDASLAANREWAREQLQRAADRAARQDALNETVALSAADLDPELAAVHARETGERWSLHGHAARAVRLRRAALAVVAARDRLLQELAADTGAPIAELDAEINDIVDAARYAGQLAEALGAVRGATFTPNRLFLVAGDAGTPLAQQAEAVFAALGAGSAVLWVVPRRFLASATALLEESEAGGLTPGAVRIETIAGGNTLAELAAHHEIDRALLLGERAAGHELAKRRPDLRIEGQFRVRGSILVAPSADLDQAISDIVASGFRAAGTDPRTAHAVLLLGSVGRSRRFRARLSDAVRALRVGDTARPGVAEALSFDLGPLPAPPSAAGLRALTELNRGEEWLVQPRQLDEHGMLWSPGVRIGVSPGSRFWEDAIGVPVIGLTAVHTLGDAIALQNAPGGGSVAGLHSTDGEEIISWMEQVHVAALAINRPTTGNRIERQPSGGWDDAVMGLPALSGGPNRLLALGSWAPRPGTRSDTLHLRGLDPEVQLLISVSQPSLGYEEFDGVRRAALTDALVWRTRFGVQRDTVGLGVERNVLRYRSVVTHLRLAEDGPIAGLIRVVAAALLVRAPVAVSTGQLLAPEIAELLERQGIPVSLERDEDWMERIAVAGPLGPSDIPASRVRLIGGDAVRVAEWMGGLDRAALWAEPVTMAGPVELLTLLREQSVSARAHRHGLAIPVPGLDEILEG